MNDEQPTQPLTDAELAEVRSTLADLDAVVNGVSGVKGRYGWRLSGVSQHVNMHADLVRLLAEVDRLRAENHGVTDENSALLRKLEEQYRRRAQSVNEITRIRNEATGTALGHLAKIERLQSQRDALVRKLGLDWGPDEFGDLSAVPDCAEQISAVVSLHQPTAMSSWGHRTCIECDTPGYYQEWPCPTLVALGFEER